MGGTISSDIVVLVIALVVILGAAELFTNGVEWLGEKLQLSEGVVGSVLAAVGTALPETLIPVVAVLIGHDSDHHDVGIGAIAGAPFMLTTLTMCVCGVSIWVFSLRKRRASEMKVNEAVLSRDLGFFVAAYGMGLAATVFHDQLWVRQLVAVLLLVIYGVYLKKTFAHEGEVGQAPEKLHFQALRLGNNLSIVVLQVLAGLCGILLGAYFFVEHTSSLAKAIDVPGVILSMIVAPIATELPEKFNSVLWARNGRDTLALGNITGALVFQSCFPVAFGLAFTHWKLGPGTVVSGIVSILFALGYLLLLRRRKLHYRYLMLGGVGYAATISWLLITHLMD